jgi:hypothetical protein
MLGLIINMKRKKFLAIAGTTIVIAGVTYYLGSDKTNFTRANIKQPKIPNNFLQPNEESILILASLAPSGHNTQPWFVKYVGAYHWIIGNDKTKWLQAVDPTQRETILSIGAFIQNLEYAANSFGYHCAFTILANNNQDDNVMEVKLSKGDNILKYDIEKIKQRRTVRNNYLGDVLKKEDVQYLLNNETDFIYYIDNTTKEHVWLNEQTIEANKIQVYRDAAQSELADWIRFSNKDAEKHKDGLTLASMEIEGMPAWLLRNFYSKKNVMKKSFRDTSIDKVVKQVSKSAGWFIITSKDDSVATLLQTGKRLQRLWLKVRDKNIAIHPMTQIIEEAATNLLLNNAIGINEPIQFILRTGYIKKYSAPVTLRRSIQQFFKT